MKNGKLILKDGTTFEGKIFGAEKSSSGEVVFSTGMVGYPESITDPSFHGQILALTAPLVGNYGTPSFGLDPNGVAKNYESEKVHIKGLVVSEYSQKFSHFKAEKSLSDFLKDAGVPGITGIDTRKLTKILREKGSMPGKIVCENQPVNFYDPSKINMIPEVSPKEPRTYKTTKGGKTKTVVMIDCGVKNNTIRSFLNRGVNIIRVGWDFDFFKSDFKAKNKFDGVFISNGPGDPALLKATVDIIKKCLKAKIPTFGICLGNQLMGLAAGAKTYKLKFGHRSQNQPCINTLNGNCYMTSQNHGYALNEKTLPKEWIVWFKHANDSTVEGIRHKKLPFMAVQFHPEASPGPVDTANLFDEFIKLL